MAAGNFLGTRADNQHRDRLRRMEERHIAEVPAGEREEIRQIFGGMGFEGDDLERVVTVITARKDRWVDTMLKEEHGLSQNPVSPWRAAAATLVAFLVIGVIPLLPFFAEYAWGLTVEPFVLSTTLTAVSFFFVGAAKSRFVEQVWYWSGLETLGVGGAAAALAYACGALLQEWA
jgi:VIT1/CCC1 family predicted Fe2+/Mn2+ transporter